MDGADWVGQSSQLGGREDRLAGEHGERERIWWAGLWFWLGDLQREREREGGVRAEME
jgi:hypothetical protein